MSEAAEDIPTAAPKLDSKKNRTLSQTDRNRVKEATDAFKKRSTEQQADPGEAQYTLADRSHWGHFEALLASTACGPEQADSEMETETDRALVAYDALVESMLQTFKARAGTSPTHEAFLEDMFVSKHLRGGVIFIGHVCTDLDSVAGAVGAAALFGGVAVRAEAELNGEIMYALHEVAQLSVPPLLEDVPGGTTPDEHGNLRKVCLVDHNEVKQMHPALRNDPARSKRIVGLIDHHAMAESFASNAPLFVDVRPWGSMSSIVAHMYVRNNAPLDKAVARLLMCAILSDTLNLQSVTTTDADRFAVALLAKRGEVEDPDEVARRMFQAKTSWIVTLGAYAMLRGDQKDFSCDGWKFGIAVLEVTTMLPVLEIADQLVLELRALKVEKGNGTRSNELDFAFLFVVDVVQGCSVLLVCGGREHALATRAFPGCPTGKAHPDIMAPGDTIRAENTLMDVGPLVSRKAQFVPAFLKVLSAGAKGFECHKHRVSSPDYVDIPPQQRLGIESAPPHFAEGSQILQRDNAGLAKAVFGQELPSHAQTATTIE